MSKELVLKVEDLNVSFKMNRQDVQILRNVNFELRRGETLAIVGESGSGKSVTVKTIAGLRPNNQRIDSGAIHFTNREGETVDLLQLSKGDMRRQINGKKIAMVFQDPMTSLNPTMKIGKQIMEPMKLHYNYSQQECRDRALELLHLVGITDVEQRFDQYPHQLSGGMRQRVVIAIALACDPEILICDEPTTALDVTIQAKILQLIKDIQAQRDLTVIYITHDLGVVANVADYVNVMYAGHIVERGSVSDIFYQPAHPYTWGLLLAMPDTQTSSETLYAIPGNPPNMANYQQGDPFYPRNDYALNIDKRQEAPMFKLSDSHYAATWLLHDQAPDYQMPEELAHRINQALEAARQADPDWDFAKDRSSATSSPMEGGFDND